MRRVRLGAPARVAIVLLAACQPAFAQTLGQGGDDGIATWRVVTALLLCLALAVFAAYALRTRLRGGAPARLSLSLFTAARPDRRLRLVETLRLSHQIDLCVVSCDGRDLLVTASAQGAQVLRELPAAAPVQETG